MEKERKSTYFRLFLDQIPGKQNLLFRNRGRLSDHCQNPTPNYPNLGGNRRKRVFLNRRPGWEVATLLLWGRTTKENVLCDLDWTQNKVWHWWKETRWSQIENIATFDDYPLAQSQLRNWLELQLPWNGLGLQVQRRSRIESHWSPQTTRRSWTRSQCWFPLLRCGCH